ncbi:accessory gland protein Acp29AB-like [Drosophila rhopaloa]|uniref:C-type lectin domain-containing protein n=1 Tax=Drosophila rhopaloa TaxID=1041015 RepID=A0ABM5J1L5_DRORH|nr:accessory gland protein Acp29AB-like [Drosophila rhopaloa]
MLKSSVIFLLAFLSYNLYGTLAEAQDNGRSVCLLNDPPSQCGMFCLEALKPMLDHIAFHQQEWSTCHPQEHDETQEKLDRIEAKLEKLLDQEEAASRNTNPLDLRTKLERIENWKLCRKAEETCRRMGGHLATIQDESDFTAIKGELKIYEHYWLGITDVAKNGEFISVASGKPAPFIKLRLALYPSPLVHCLLLEEVSSLNENLSEDYDKWLLGGNISGRIGLCE